MADFWDKRENSGHWSLVSGQGAGWNEELTLLMRNAECEMRNCGADFINS